VLAAKIPDDDRDRIQRSVEAEIAEAIGFAESSPFPADDELYAGVLHD
jgi:TPP-dependent pyruvate/acetoin dehydrogenase alpha subunit